MEIQPGPEQRIFLDALASYADACVQPALTPSCPFYVNNDGVPTCQEQCQDILASHGVSARPVAEHNIGGLVMVGREIPVRSVSGSKTFDAAEEYIRDQDKPPSARSTSALLISLRVALFKGLYRDPRPDDDDPFELWGTLLQRGIEMDRVFVGAIARELAVAVAVRVLVRLAEDNSPTPTTDSSVHAEGSNALVSAWSDVVEFGMKEWAAEAAVRPRHPGEIQVDLQSILPGFFADEDSMEQLLAQREIVYLLSPAFLIRATRWFASLLEHDLSSVLSAGAPDPHLFAGLQPIESSDEVGEWIWERFTQTELRRWSATSLAQEWKWQKFQQSQACAARTLRERQLAADVVAEAAMLRASESSGRRIYSDGLEPDEFVERASELLQQDHPEEAARIFQGLLDMRPGDGHAWNNLGFCQIKISPAKALPLLQRGTSLQHPIALISIANQVLTLHLLERDDEALALAEEHLALAYENQAPAYVWRHTQSGDPLRLDDDEPRNYLNKLVRHIRSGACQGDAS